MPRLRAYVLPDLGVVAVLNYSDFVVEFLSPDPFGDRLTISTLRSVVSFALGRFSISGWEGCHKATSAFRTSDQLDFVEKDGTQNTRRESPHCEIRPQTLQFRGLRGPMIIGLEVRSRILGFKSFCRDFWRRVLLECYFHRTVEEQTVLEWINYKPYILYQMC
jgi:hypothetical protein